MNILLQSKILRNRFLIEQKIIIAIYHYVSHKMMKVEEQIELLPRLI